MPCLTDIVADLQEHVTQLKNGQVYSVPQREHSTSSSHSSSSSTPLRPSSGASTPRLSSDSDAESEMASISTYVYINVLPKAPSTTSLVIMYIYGNMPNHL